MKVVSVRQFERHICPTPGCEYEFPYHPFDKRHEHLDSSCPWCRHPEYKIRAGQPYAWLRYWDFDIENLVRDCYKDKELAAAFAEEPDLEDASSYFASPDAATVNNLTQGALFSENVNTPAFIGGGDGVHIQLGKRTTTIIGMQPLLNTGSSAIAATTFRVLLVREGPKEPVHCNMLCRHTVNFLNRVAPCGPGVRCAIFAWVCGSIYCMQPQQTQRSLVTGCGGLRFFHTWRTGSVNLCVLFRCPGSRNLVVRRTSR